VTAPLALRITLITPSAILNALVILPATIPDVIDTFRLAITACSDPDRTDVSESHVVRSHAVGPALTDGE
jgi:hypothetical protein